MASSDDAKTKTPVIVALDWTPNGNHLGFYVALDAGVYADAGLDVRLVSPSDADYKGSYTPSDDATASDAAATATPYVTPCSKVAAGDAHFAINSPEGVLGWNTADGRPRLKAVAALLHDRNTSAIVTLRSSGKASPADLDGATYASYAARFEGRIVREIIRHAGGKGDFREVTPPMLGVFETLVKGDADATWIFKQWEGVEAVLEGIDLNVFTLLDNGVPYAYNPCLCAHPEWLRANAATARAFLEATAEGYRRAADDPGAAADALLRLAKKHHPEVKIGVHQAHASADYLATRFLDPETKAWGRMEARVWDEYVRWLWDRGLLTTGLNSRHPDGGATFSLDDLRDGKAGERIDLESVPTVFTNEYLPPLSSSSS